MTLRRKEKHERRVSVCSKQGCTKCPFAEAYVPESCEYMMLHLLADSDDLGRQVNIRARQSGKTTEVIRKARIHADAGRETFILTPNMQQRRWMERQLRAKGIDNIKVKSMSQCKDFFGQHDAAVFSDEVPESDIQEKLLRCLPIEAYMGGMAT